MWNEVGVISLIIDLKLEDVFPCVNNIS